MQIKEKINTFNASVIFPFALAMIFGLVLLKDIKFGIILFMVLLFVLFVSIFYIFAKSARSILFFIFFYPLLPYHLGYNFSQSLPVLKIHRILTAFILLYWLVKSKTAITSIKIFPLTKIFLAMLVPMCLASTFSTSPLPSFFYTISFSIEYFLFAIMFFDLCTDEKIIQRIFLIIALSSFLIGLVGIFEFYSGKNLYAFIRPFRSEISYAISQQERQGLFRIRGSFDHSIAFGTYLGLSLVSVINLYTLAKGMVKKLFFIIIFFVISYTIFLTFSRAAVGFFTVFILTILLLKRRRELIILGILAFCFMLQPFFLQDLKTRLIFMFKSTLLPFEYGTREMIESSMNRITQYNVITKLIMQKPWFGYGKVFLDLGSVDNFYLLFVMYFGLISFAGFVLVNLAILFKCFFLFMKAHSENIKLFGLAMAGALLGVFLVWQGVSLDSYFYLLWLYIGIAMRLYYDEKCA